jgi:isopenicillin N synthase-like dioxygenase
MLPVITPDSSEKEIQSACSEWGAFYFPFKSDHSSIVSKVFEHEHPAPILRGGLKRGYLGYGMESGSDLFEAKQGFSFGMPIDQPCNKLQGQNVWPLDFTQDLKQSCLELFADLCESSLLILKSISLSLGKDKDYLGQYCSKGDSISICRIFNYLSMEEALNRFPGHSKYAGSSEHTDWGFITLIIAQDNQFGLEIFKNNQWIPICGKNDFVIVNIGDYLSSLTRGMYHSPLHRVVLDDDEERTSTVFFFYPDYSSKIPILVQEWESQGVISENCFGDLLYEKWDAVSRNGY